MDSCKNEQKEATKRVEEGKARHGNQASQAEIILKGCQDRSFGKLFSHKLVSLEAVLCHAPPLHRIWSLPADLAPGQQQCNQADLKHDEGAKAAEYAPN